MKRLKSLKPGTIFNFAQEKFVVLEQLEDGVFCLLAQSKKSVPFNDKEGVEDWNNYIGSTLEDEVNAWLAALPKTSDEEKAILPFTVDLSCTDRSKSYGEIAVKAAPLTLWQYGKYKEIIPLNEDDWWWLVTPWACRWLRSPYTGNTYYAWRVYTNGYYYSNYCSYSCGIRPALKLSSELLVSVDGEEDEENECCECGGCAADLSGFSTSELLAEIGRRADAAEAKIYASCGEDEDAEDDGA